MAVKRRRRDDRPVKKESPVRNNGAAPEKPAASEIDVAMPDNTVQFKKPARRRAIKKREIGGFDVPYFMLTIMLMLIGLVMLYSASYSSAYYYQGDALYFIWKQLLFAAMGIVVMFIVMNIPYQFYHKLAFPALVIAILLLVLVLFIGQTRNLATRWIGIGETLTFQPSEIAKAAIIISFSSLAVRLGRQRMKSMIYGIIPFMAIIGMMGVLLMKEPHLSATIIITLTGIIIIFLAGADIKKLVVVALIAAAIGAWIIFGMGYGHKRIQIWLDPFSDAKGDGYQIIQSLYALGSGGLWGLGLGQSRQKHLFLPEPYNDFIFAIVCEELGFVGGALILILFAAFVIRGYYIALRARDSFGTLLAAGVTTQIALQVLFNIGVVTGLLPVTGASLPFFSSGGSSLVLLFAELGIVLSVSRQIPAPQQTSSIEKKKIRRREKKRGA